MCLLAPYSTCVIITEITKLKCWWTWLWFVTFFSVCFVSLVRSLRGDLSSILFVFVPHLWKFVSCLSGIWRLRWRLLSWVFKKYLHSLNTNRIKKKFEKSCKDFFFSFSAVMYLSFFYHLLYFQPADINPNVTWSGAGFSSFILVLLWCVGTFLFSYSLYHLVPHMDTHSFILSWMLAVTIWSISPSDPTHLSAPFPPFLPPLSLFGILSSLFSSSLSSSSLLLCPYSLIFIFLLHLLQSNNGWDVQRDPRAPVFFTPISSAFPFPVPLSLISLCLSLFKPSMGGG